MFEKLKDIRRRNNEVRQRMVDYLNDNPRLITPELIREVDPAGVLPAEDVYNNGASKLLDAIFEYLEE